MRDLRAREPDPDADSAAYQDFLDQCEAAIAQHPLWRRSADTATPTAATAAHPDDLESAGEALEKYLASKLHDRLFGPAAAAGPSGRADAADRDAVVAARAAALQGLLRPEHLEVPRSVAGLPGFEAALEEAAAQLRRVGSFKAPRDKLICVLNAAAAINGLLQGGGGGGRGGGDNDGNINATPQQQATDGGADAFQPLLVLALVRSQCPQLPSNVAFVERYRSRRRMARGAAAYYFVALASAAAFVESVDAAALSGVTRDEFLAHMLAAGAVTEEQLAAMSAAAERVVEAPAGEATAAAAPVATAAATAAPAAAPAAPRPPAPQPPPPPPPLLALSPPGPLQRFFLPPLSVAALEAQGAHLLAAAGDAPAAAAAAHAADRARMAAALSSSQQQQSQHQPPPPPPAPAPAALAALVAQHPFAFAALEGLTVADVASLLAQHKELVLRYASLRAAVEHHYERAHEQEKERGEGKEEEAGEAAAAAERLSPVASPQQPAAAAAGGGALVTAGDDDVGKEEQQERAAGASVAAAATAAAAAPPPPPPPPPPPAPAEASAAPEHPPSKDGDQQVDAILEDLLGVGEGGGAGADAAAVAPVPQAVAAGGQEEKQQGDGDGGGFDDLFGGLTIAEPVAGGGAAVTAAAAAAAGQQGDEGQQQQLEPRASLLD
jgi:hypothetical protein